MAGVVPRPSIYERWVTLARSTNKSSTTEGPFIDLTPNGVWCSIQPQGGNIGDRSSSHLVEMYFHPQVTIDTRIRYRGRDLFVKSVVNVNEDDTVLRLLCEEVAA